MINKIIGFALAVVICSSAVAQSITVKGYGDKSITIDQDYHFDVNRKARGTYPETNIKQGYSFKDNHIEIVTYIHTLGQNEVGHSGKFYTQQIDKVLCYYPDFNAQGAELITTITDNYLNNLGTNVKAIVRLTSKREDKKYFYCFSAENNNNIDGSGDIAEGAFLEMTIPNVEVAFTSLSKAEAFKKMLDDKIFDYALNLDAPSINYPFGEGNTFSVDYPDGRLAKADEPSPTESEVVGDSPKEIAAKKIKAEANLVEINGKTFYLDASNVYDSYFNKIGSRRTNSGVTFDNGKAAYNFTDGNIRINQNEIYYLKNASSTVFYDKACQSVYLKMTSDRGDNKEYSIFKDNKEIGYYRVNTFATSLKEIACLMHYLGL